jgi:2-polyprenyl-6-methoxyphenol hydroxylase-like FAD-dependent oxidoreductase
MRGRGVQVLIVGAGLAGLAAARTLTAWGAEVRIVERAPRPRATGAGIYLHANAIRALDDLGLAGDVAARALTIQRQQVGDRHGRLLFDLDTRDLWPGLGPCLALPRTDLHQVLLAGAKDVPVRWACGPEAISDSPDDVWVDFSDGTSAAFDLVIGADGVHSTVRRLVFNQSAARPAGQYAYRFLARWPDAPTTWSLRLGRKAAVLTIPVTAEHVYCYCDAPLTDPPRPLPDILAECGDPMPALLDRAEPDVHSAPNEDVVLDRWSQGVVVLIGDAAHATAPNMAQGAAMAVEDAIVLAESLSVADTISAALHAYERRRRPRTDWVLAQTRRREASRRLPPVLRDPLLHRAGRKLFHSNYRPLRATP